MNHEATKDLTTLTTDARRLLAQRAKLKETGDWGATEVSYFNNRAAELLTAFCDALEQKEKSDDGPKS